MRVASLGGDNADHRFPNTHRAPAPARETYISLMLPAALQRGHRSPSRLQTRKMRLKDITITQLVPVQTEIRTRACLTPAVSAFHCTSLASRGQTLGAAGPGPSVPFQLRCPACQHSHALCSATSSILPLLIPQPLSQRLKPECPGSWSADHSLSNKDLEAHYKCKILGPTSDLLNQDVHFKILRGLEYAS